MSTSFLHIIDILGSFAFAVSGAFLAMEKKLDPFGVLVISFVTAIGGGTVRDILIGNVPVSWLRNETAILVIFIAAIITMIFDGYLRKFPITLFLFDALGIGLFTLIGTDLAIEKDFSFGVCVAIGTITACFGGVLRDVLLNVVPLLFRKEVYALACTSGAIMYLILLRSEMDINIARLICIFLVVIIRILAVRFKWSLPRFYQSNSTT